MITCPLWEERPTLHPFKYRLQAVPACLVIIRMTLLSASPLSDKGLQLRSSFDSHENATLGERQRGSSLIENDSAYAGSSETVYSSAAATSGFKLPTGYLRMQIAVGDAGEKEYAFVSFPNTYEVRLGACSSSCDVVMLIMMNAAAAASCPSTIH